MSASNESTTPSIVYPVFGLLSYHSPQINERLQEAWEARNGPSGQPPFVSLMGSLIADESFKSRQFLEKWVSK